VIQTELLMVRIYLTESEHKAHQLLEFLRESGVMGASLLRGISGYGASGTLHRADWLDLSGDLPLLLEFVDDAAKVEAVIPELLQKTEPGHMLCWRVTGLAPGDGTAA